MVRIGANKPSRILAAQKGLARGRPGIPSHSSHRVSTSRSSLPWSGRRPLRKLRGPRPWKIRSIRRHSPFGEGAVVGHAPWLGPQTVLEGRPPALMDASAKGRYVASLFGVQLYLAGHRATWRALVRVTLTFKGSLRGPDRK